MIKIAICDDDKDEAILISSLLKKFIASHLVDYTITFATYQNGVDLLDAIEKGQSFDVFLLDVIMPLVNGIEVATEIRILNSVSKIIFLTASPEFAVDAYGVEAFHYLLKPIKEESFFSVLNKACADSSSDAKKHIMVKRGNCVTKLLLNNLHYAEVVGHNIYFYLKTGELIQSMGTMSQLEVSLLKDKRFIKPHRSYIVNMDYIENLSSKGISMVRGAHIPISRSLQKEIMQVYISYSFDRE